MLLRRPYQSRTQFLASSLSLRENLEKILVTISILVSEEAKNFASQSPEFGIEPT